MQIRKNIKLGLEWIVVSKPFELTTCLVPNGKHKINITLPTGRVERFVAANAQECALVVVPAVDIKFHALPGTTSRLEILNIPYVQAQGGQLIDIDNMETWNPKEFKLTTEDNYVYHLSDCIGITRVTDPSGNTLTYGENGIVHSNGQSVLFERDPAGRIAAVTDPAGKRIEYRYSAAGDLAAVTDRTGGVSKFTYNGKHGLLDYTDPLGIVAARYTYDENGRLVSVTDGAGKTIETTHDLANNKEIVKDRRGNVTTYTYDGAGNITEKVDALGNRTSFAYDALGNETSTTDALGNITLKSFDAHSGKQLTDKDPLGNTMSWTYNAAYMSESSVDARGNTTYFRYGGNGSQMITGPLGHETYFGLDSKGDFTTLSVGGQATTYAYDGKGNRISETDAAGNVTNYTYDANNRQTGASWTRVAGSTPQTIATSSKLDAEGRIVEQTDAFGNVSKTEYNAGGKVTASVDAQGRRTTFEYDARSKLVKTTYPDGTAATTSYDAEGNTASTTDRQGRVTAFAYDALNRLTRTTYPDGASSGTEYDAIGRVAASTDAKGNRIANKYDAAGRVSEVVDAHDKRTSFTYDPNGNRTSATDANGKVSSFEYDALNRLVKTTLPDGKVQSTVWNLNGTKASETDAAGNTTAYGYDAMARLNKVTQTDAATLQVTGYGFDGQGNKTSQTDAEGRITRWSYDAGNRVTSRTLPGGQSESFSYDALGRRTGHTDFNGQSTTTSYNTIGQPVLTLRPDGTRIATSFTLSGQVARISVETTANSGIQAGATSYAYDAQDRLTRQTNPDGSYLAYGYDANGNITERSTSAGTVAYAYDAGDRMASVTDSTGKITRYTYDALGRPDTVALPNGVTTSHSYDDNGRLLQMLHRRADGSMVTGVRYGLADNGQRVTLEEFDEASTVGGAGPLNAVRTSAYRYDGTGRLTEEQVKDRSGAVIRTTGYVYDKVGNRSTKTEVTAAGTETIAYSYDSNDRLTQENKTTTTGSAVLTVYSWDANGNLKSKTTGGQGTYYEWNSDGRLVEVKQGEDRTTIAKYSYDAGGNRVAKIEGDKTISYLTDSTFEYARILQESTTQGQGTSATDYVWGRDLIAQDNQGQQHYYHAAGLGSIKALTGSSGAVTDTYSYDAFGTIAERTGSSLQSYRYTGEYFDDAIRLQFNRDRWLDLNAGRFVSGDTFMGAPARPKTLNRYVYANSDAVNMIDPSGRFGLTEVGVANNITNTLNSFQINLGFDLGNAALTGEGPDPVIGIGLVVMGGAGLKIAKNLVRKMRPFFIRAGLMLAGARISSLRSPLFDEYLAKMLGSAGEFKFGMSNFDGKVDKLHLVYEAKSGWEHIHIPKNFASFKQQLSRQQVDANTAGFEHVLFSNKPIPVEVKDWLETKGIRYFELLD